MESLATVMLVVMVAALLIHIPLDALCSKRIRWYRQKVQEERSRAALAVARTKMFDMVVKGKLSPKSETFKTFYPALTSLMRRPDEYDKLLPKFARGLGKVKQDADSISRLAEEAKSWSREMEELILCVAEAVVDVFFQHSRLVRVAYKMHRVKKSVLLTNKMLLAILGRKNREAAEAAVLADRYCRDLVQA